MNTINNVLWAQKFGGTQNDAPTGIVVDSSGNTYVTGYFYNTATFGSTTLTSDVNLYSNPFVTKLDSSGKFLWAQKFSNSSGLGGPFDPSTDITIDASGNTYITGNFSGTATFGNITLTSGVNQFFFNTADAFITKLDSSGNFLWAQKLGGTSNDAAKGITVDASGNTYVTGTFSDTATFGSTTLTSAGNSDGFITKLDNSGNVLWAKKFGGTSLDNGYDIAADGAGNTYVTGGFTSTATFGDITLTSNGSAFGNPFITKLDSSGKFLWAQKFVTNSYSPGGAITVDSLGNTYITGSFFDTATFGNTTLNSGGNQDAFITKLDSSGKFLWAQKLGGASDDSGNDITVDSSGNIYVTGRFSSTVTFGNTTLTSAGNTDVFVAKLDSNGNVLSAKKLGGTSSDAGNGIAIDGTGNTYVTGTFNSTATFGSTTLTNSSLGLNSDGFIVKLGQQDITLALTPSSVVEDGSNNLIYTFTREGNTTNPVTVNFNVGGNATFNTDYTAVGADTFTATNGTVTFAAGATTATVTIDPTADTTFEPDETVGLTLAAGGGYSIVTSAAVTGNITNDDTQVTLALAANSVTEDGSDNLIYTFTRQGQTTDPLTVNFNVAGTATVDNDYTQTGATNGTVTFAAGATTATVTIDPTADTTVESDETVGLTLAAGTGYSIGTSEAVTGNITNDDTQISLAVTRSISTSGSNVVWAQKFGGTFGEDANAITVDSSGNTYVTGNFSGSATFGNTSLTGAGLNNAFITKLDSSGKFLWAQKFGSGIGSDITVDASGNTYVTGFFNNTATFGNTTLTSASGSNDAFITKLDSTGNILWAQKLGGTSDDKGNGITVDALGNTYITGNFSGTATFGSTTLTAVSQYAISTADGFITKLDNSGNVLWAKKWGGTASDNGYDIAADASGNTYVTGTFSGTTTFGNTTLTSDGSAFGNPFITKLDSSGNFLWAQKFNIGTSYTGSDIIVDSLGNSYITGSFYGIATFGNTTLTSPGSTGSSDTFITKLDSSGKFLWAKNLGGTSDDFGNDITVDSSGNIYVTGRFSGTGTFGNITLTADSISSDAFVVKLDNNGNVLSAKKFGGSSYDSGNGIAIDGAGNTYVTGSFNSTATFGNTSLTSVGTSDGFVVKLAEPQISLPLTPNSVVEDGSNNLTYTFTRQGQTTDPLTVNFNVGGDATLNTDYTAAGANTFTASNGTVTFAAGATIASVTIDPTADTIFEPDETVGLTLAAGTGYAIATSEAVTGNITNDDTQVTLALAASSVAEDGNDNLIYTFTRQGKTTDPLTVNFNVGGNATFNTDYTALGANIFTPAIGIVTFAAGATTATVTIDPSADTIFEPDETVGLTLAAGTGYSIGTSGAVTGNITNDDTQVTLALAASSVAEDGSNNLIYTFTRQGKTTDPLTVNFNVGGNATFNTDYTALGANIFTPAIGTVTFAAGASTATVTIDPTADTTVESDETVGLTLAAGTGYSIGTSGAVTGNITNDDTQVTLAVTASSVVEDGSNNLIYTFTRQGKTTDPLTVNFNVGGNATFNTDYTALGANIFTPAIGTVTFAAGASTATVTIDPTPDTTVESDETVGLTLATGTGYSIGTSEAVTGNITNDDTQVTLALAASSVAEDGSNNLIYTFTRQGQTTDPLTVNFNVGGNATFNTDYTALGANIFTPAIGTVTFAAGASTATVTIDPTPDTTVESDETVGLTLATGTGYSIGTSEAVTGNITNDDTQVTLALAASSVAEDGSNNLIYTFTRQGQTTDPLTVNFNVGGNATFNTDYTALGANIFTPAIGTVTFAAGASTATVTIDPTADTTVESDETVGLTLAAGTGYSIGTSEAVTGNITNDDTQVTLALAASSVAEDGSNNLIYTFTRQGKTTDPLTVNFNVGGNATFNTDYTALGANIFTPAIGTVTFAAGATTATVTIDPTADTTVESDETVGLTLAAGTGYSIGTSGAVTGNITNDDTQVTLALAASSVAEDGSNNLIYTFTRQGQTTDPLTVNFNVGGNATFNTDYTALGANIFTPAIGTVTFAAGASTATVTIDPTADTTVESDETVGLTLAAGTGYSIGTSEAVTGNITNDDTQVTLALAASSVAEDGNDNLIYTFTRQGKTTDPLTVNFNVGGNATFNTDYTALGANIFTPAIGIVTFAAGATTATVTIDPTADTTVESDETVGLTLAAGTGYSIGTSGAVTGNITNDDTQITLAVTASSVAEDGSDNLIYTFTRQGQTTDPLTVNFNVAGTATVENDYTQTGATSFTATNGTVTFAAGATTATVTIDPSADTTFEPDETVELTLAAGTGYNIGTSEAVTGNIFNDDIPPTVFWGIAGDAAGNAYVTGAFTGQFDFGNTSFSSTNLTSSDALIFKFDSNFQSLWAQKLGGTLTDVGVGIAADAAGNSYVTGFFSGTASFGSTSLTSAGDSDAFVTKLDTNGNVLWAQNFGGTLSDQGWGVTVDSTGNIYGTGTFSGTASFGSTTLTSAGDSDAFITKLDTNGNVLWAQNFGGTSADKGVGITSDGAGNTYATGTFSGTASFGSTTLTSAGDSDAFITKLDSTGNFLWAQKLGGTFADSGFGITVDRAGNTYVSGVFRDTASFGSTSLTSAGDSDAFVAKLDANGNVVWAKKFGGSGVDEGTGIVADGSGNINFTGVFSGTASFDGITLTSVGDADAFNVTLDSNGNILSVSSSGNTSLDLGVGIATDGVGSIYSTGVVSDTASFSNTSLTSTGFSNPSISKFEGPQITLALAANSVAEDGSDNLIYTFTRQGQTTNELTVNFNVGGTATLDNDYTQTGATNNTVTFAAGATTATVTIDPTADTIFEPDETVELTLAAGTGYAIATSEAVTGNITNDDTQVTLALAANSVTEDGTDNLIYTFTRQGQTTNALTVNFNVGGTATVDNDYTQTGATNNTVTFAAGATTATVTIDPTADTTVESDETVGLTLAAGTGYAIATSEAVTGNITNDDTQITLALAANSVTEDGTDNLTYTFTREGQTTDPLTVNFNVGGDVTFNDDYTAVGTDTFTATNGTVTFAAGATTATVTIDPTTDTKVEPDEILGLTLAGGTGYNIGTSEVVTGNITNDDSQVTVSSAPNTGSIFNLEGAAQPVNFLLKSASSGAVNEIGLFQVDDDKGTIGGVAPDDPKYAQTALDNSRSIFSTLPNRPNGFNDNLSSNLDLGAGVKFRLLLVQNGTIDGLRNGTVPLSQMLLSSPTSSEVADGKFDLSFQNSPGTVVQISLGTEDLKGSGLQDKQQGEVLDLTKLTGTQTATFTVYREAGYNNLVGFYRVADINGGIDTNNDGVGDLLPGQAGYAEAAVKNRVGGINLSVGNQGTASFTGTFEGGSIFAPFLIVNATADAFLDNNPNNNPAIYFPYLGANSDNVDHVRMLGDNIFGFEDLPGGGDKDFNDIIVKVNIA
ncbi:MAG: SBBP repeat-containing protein [Gloeotrichia echinulata IR180]